MVAIIIFNFTIIIITVFPLEKTLAHINTTSMKLNGMFSGSVIPCCFLCVLKYFKRSQTFLSLYLHQDRLTEDNPQETGFKALQGFSSYRPDCSRDRGNVPIVNRIFLPTYFLSTYYPPGLNPN